MARCAKCNTRKGKRLCPALGKSICSLCCGQLREKEIHCPPSCPFLAQHKSYQDQRLLQKKLAERSAAPQEPDILSDERLTWLIFNIEMPIAQFAREKDILADGDALRALEYAREKVIRETGVFIVPDGRLQPGNDLGEAIFHSLQQCRYEKTIIVPGSLQQYKKDEKIQCLDRVILAVKHLSGDHFQGNRYLQQLIDRLTKIEELSRQQRIVTSSS